MSEVIIETFDFAKEGARKGGATSAFELGLAIHKNAVANQIPDTGALRNSLMVISNEREYGFNSQPDEKAPSNKKIDVTLQKDEVAVGSNMDYATYQEFGTRYQVAQPYLRPAGLAARGGTAKQIFEKYGKEQMDREFEQRKKRSKKI